MLSFVVNMQKDFDEWNIEKKLTDRTNLEINFYEREAWWYIAGLNIGVEIDGKHELFLRPCIVVRKFNKDMLLIVPTTTQNKDNKYYYRVTGTENRTYNTCLSQIRAISSKRLFRKIDTINIVDYEQMLDKISDMIKGLLADTTKPRFNVVSRRPKPIINYNCILLKFKCQLFEVK